MAISLIHADCLTAMASMPEASVDSLVSDPPYGIRFMGKSWDGADIDSVIQRKMRERTERPDGYKLHEGVAFAAGTYDVSATGNRAFQEWTRLWAHQAFRILKPGGQLLAFSSPRTYHRMASGIEDAGFEIRDQLQWLYGSGFPKSHNLDGDREGFGTALKPANEPIVLARKPLSESSVAANVRRWGTGALNIDGCRVHADDAQGGSYVVKRLKPGATLDKTGGNWRPEHGPEYHGEMKPGRWPANVIHDGSDEVQDAFPDAPGQIADARTDGVCKTRNVYGAMRYGERSTNSENVGEVGFKMRPGARRGDSGSAARFFYCAKASTSERDDGLENFEINQHVQFATANGTSGKASSISEGRDTRRRNTHPTVKPTALMQWLVRLVTPPGGTVLDPFMGSGTTGRACVLEGFGFIGIEREAEYVEIARARIAATERRVAEEAQKTQEASETALDQLSLFEEAAA